MPEADGIVNELASTQRMKDREIQKDHQTDKKSPYSRWISTAAVSVATKCRPPPHGGSHKKEEV